MNYFGDDKSLETQKSCNYNVVPKQNHQVKDKEMANDYMHQKNLIQNVFL